MKTTKRKKNEIHMILLILKIVLTLISFILSFMTKLPTFNKFVLATYLSLLVYAIISEVESRHKNNVFNQLLDLIKLKTGALPPMLLNRTDIPSIEIQLKNTKEIWLMFNTGRDFINNNFKDLKKWCSKKDFRTLKVISAEGNSDSLRIWGKMVDDNKDKEGKQRDFEKEVDDAREKLQSLKSKIRKKIRHKSFFSPIPFTLMATNPYSTGSEEGEIVVALNCYKNSEERPYIHLKSDDETGWYNFFKTEFEIMWGPEIDNNLLK